jgi:hypothetical protein
MKINGDFLSIGAARRQPLSPVKADIFAGGKLLAQGSPAMKSAVLLCAAVFLSGCATGHLYPVRGALAQQTPAPVYKVKMDSGDAMNATLANGEK